jgi:5-methylcytosine-specific restriction endonuclease McrA
MMNTSIDTSVLVLNRLWQAVNVCSAKRAFSLVYLGQAHIVDAANGYQTFNFEEWKDASEDADLSECVHTIDFKIRIPQIIVLMLFDRLPKKEVKLTRQNVFLRDRFTCQYCGKPHERKDLNIDHVLPRAHGGKTTWENIVCSCIRCNTRKGSRTPEQARMHLIQKPVKPKPRTFLHLQISRVPHDSWKTFLDVAYWNVELSD